MNPIEIFCKMDENLNFDLIMALFRVKKDPTRQIWGIW